MPFHTLQHHPGSPTHEFGKCVLHLVLSEDGAPQNPVLCYLCFTIMFPIKTENNWIFPDVGRNPKLSAQPASALRSLSKTSEKSAGGSPHRDESKVITLKFNMSSIKLKLLRYLQYPKFLLSFWSSAEHSNCPPALHRSRLSFRKFLEGARKHSSSST